jgi:hypothetical protein
MEPTIPQPRPMHCQIADFFAKPEPGPDGSDLESAGRRLVLLSPLDSASTWTAWQ